MSEVNKETSVAETKGFNAIANIEALNEAMKSDCQGMEFSFDKIKLPTGGGLAFEVPSIEQEEPEMKKEIKGVILFHHTANSYYKEKFNGQNNPPECFSTDGIAGHGIPGGKCADCPFNKFGSGENQSKACKNKRMIYLLMEGEMFPYMLNLPTGSLHQFSQYVKGNLSKGRKLSRIVTKITLKKVANKTGIAYSQAVFSMDRALTDEEVKAIEPMIDIVKTYAETHIPSTEMWQQTEDDALPFVNEETGEVVKPLK